MSPPDGFEFEQAREWAKVRETARDAFDRGATYMIHASGATHTVDTLAKLAAVTRRERARWGVAWDEDPGARQTRRN